MQTITTTAPLLQLQLTLIKIRPLERFIICTLIILKSVEHPRGSKLDSARKFRYMRTRWEDITVRTMFGISKLSPLSSLRVLVPYATS